MILTKPPAEENSSFFYWEILWGFLFLFCSDIFFASNYWRLTLSLSQSPSHQHTDTEAGSEEVPDGGITQDVSSILSPSTLSRPR